ncbi:uncharacterized protein LOC121390999, partial [Gigantopelta aegis]|uniref:uncharacterized protein LOC121390999 n=1 Tax=Gigantopelta aegis TaxID=1735272 RepID=UPI001B88A76D
RDKDWLEGWASRAGVRSGTGKGTGGRGLPLLPGRVVPLRSWFSLARLFLACRRSGVRARRVPLSGFGRGGGVPSGRSGRAATRAVACRDRARTLLQPSRGLPQLAAAPRASSVSAGIQQPTQNWYGPGESDCLIKTKHCDGRHPVLTQCDFCPVL